MATFKIRVTGDFVDKKGKSRVFDQYYEISSIDKVDAQSWGYKQAESIGLTSPIVSVKDEQEAVRV